MLSQWREKKQGWAFALLAATTIGWAAAAPGTPPADRVEAARQILQEARRTAAGISAADEKGLEFRDFALAVIAGWQMNAQDAHEALRTASAIESVSAKAVVLSIIAEVQAKAGDVAGADQTREQAVRIVTNADEQAGTLNQIAKEQAKAGNFAEALKTTAAIERASTKASALLDISRIQARARDGSGAAQTRELALGAAAAIRDAEQKAQTLEEIAEEQAKAGDIAGALKTAAAIEDVSQNGYALSTIAEAQAKAGDISGALKTAAAIESALSRANVQCEIAEAQAKAGDAAGASYTRERALKSAATIEQVGYRGETLFKLVKAHMNAGDVSGALLAAASIKGRAVSRWTLPSG